MEKKILASIISILIVIMILFSFNFDVTTSKTSNETLHYTNKTEIISPVEDGVTSSAVSALNNSYLSFDGVNDYINRTNRIFFSDTDSFTYSLWINPRVCGNGTTPGAYVAGLIGNYQRNALGLQYACTISFGLRNSTNSSEAKTSSSLVQVRRWNHILGTYNASNKNYTLFINGVVSDTYISQITNVSDDISNKFNSIFRNVNTIAGNGVFYNGFGDEARIYNRTVTYDEARAIYSSGRYANASLPSDGLLLWMSFNEANGTTVYDSSGNNNLGVLIG